MKLPTERYGTHRLYPYKGAMHPGLARKMLEICDPIYKDKILDPFCGSGTIPVEAVMHGYTVDAIDVLPTACIATQVKTHFAPGEEPELDSTETKLQSLMTGRSLEDAHQDIILAFEEMRRVVENQELRLGECKVLLTDVRTVHVHERGKYDIILTSPPYGALIDYVELATPALIALGYPSKRIAEFREASLPLSINQGVVINSLAFAFRTWVPATGQICLAVGNDKSGYDYVSKWRASLLEADFVPHCETPHVFKGVNNEIVQEEILHYVIR